MTTRMKLVGLGTAAWLSACASSAGPSSAAKPAAQAAPAQAPAQMAQPADPSRHVWTVTYLKANDGQRERLRTFLEQNWLAMDRAAVQQGLIARYELHENLGPEPREWDVAVAVEYFDESAYDGIKDRFEQIRAAHQVVLIDGRGLKDLGAVVRGDTTRRRLYGAAPAPAPAQR